VQFDFSMVDTGATAWVLASSALVLLMTPGLAFFYGGMVRTKNVLAMLMQNFTAMALVSVLWVTIGFTLAFSGGNRFIGNLDFAGMNHLGTAIPGFTGTSAQTIPPVVFVAFQMMFAVITAALITGATADRWKFAAFITFTILWSLLVYAPIAHWVFSPTGWANQLGALDFAGGSVVHINAGAAALAMAIVLGRRRGWPEEQMRPHNLPFVLLGAALLWFGWFGFNSGSALHANLLAGYAFLNTNTAAAAALLAWVSVEKLRYGKPTTLGAASGLVAGLVAVTPCAGFVSPIGALVIGLLAGALCALAVALKTWMNYDDSLDVVGVHLVGGLVGTVGLGLLATTSVNPAGANGLFYGGSYALLGKQVIAALAVAGYSFVVTLLIGSVIGKLIGNRVSARQERAGLDLALHGEAAYEAGVLAAGQGIRRPTAAPPHAIQRADAQPHPDGDKLPPDGVRSTGRSPAPHVRPPTGMNH
jgi:Amt family ammonium transporter